MPAYLRHASTADPTARCSMWPTLSRTSFTADRRASTVATHVRSPRATRTSTSRTAADRTTATLDARASRDDAHVDQHRPTPASLSRATLRRTVRSTSSRHATHAAHALKPRDTERPRR